MTVVIPAKVEIPPTVKLVLMATVEALITKVDGELIVEVPEDELWNDDAVTMPLNLPSPSTVRAEDDIVVPIPTFFDV